MIDHSDKSLRAKTASVRRQHVMDAAARIFGERGFHRATIREVANAAGVSDGTIYNIFESKEALLVGMLDPLGEMQTPANVTTAAPADLEILLSAMLQRRWDCYTPQTLDMLRAVLSEVLVDKGLRKRFVKRVVAPAAALAGPPFAALAAEGKIASDDLELTLQLVTGAFLGMLVLRLLGDEQVDGRSADVPAALAVLLTRGLRPRAPIKA